MKEMMTRGKALPVLVNEFELIKVSGITSSANGQGVQHYISLGIGPVHYRKLVAHHLRRIHKTISNIA